MPKIDHREHDEICDLSDKKGYTVCHLEFGDYESDPVDGKVIRIERKSDDLFESMKSGNIFHQLQRMNDDPETMQGFLVIDRSFTSIMREAIERDMSPNVLYGFVAFLCRMGYSPLFLDSKYNTIEVVDKIFEKQKKDIKVHQRTILGGDDLLLFPGVGTKTGELLLERFGSFKAIANATVEELKVVEGIGNKTATIIHDLCNKRYD